MEEVSNILAWNRRLFTWRALSIFT